ncbi:MFS transporter [Fictibacillus nanhaiensis]|uniref:MFS transporter n=1 Tax=Fictibacillus nanhaiensis TaxID=742169 RepID=UPI001C965AF3|nr:MFS transporter [Fictibacillus nanhaiensis]MBY6037681.1 MFS transporter [Fictibacillus nanhaiensis]
MYLHTNQKQIKTNSPIYYGWYIVFIGALGLFFSGPGQTYSISVFIDAYIRDFGWSRSLVSGLYSVATLLAGLLLSFIGIWIDRYGQRKMAVIIGTLLALTCFWNSTIAGPIALFIGFFFLRILGQGSMTLIPNTLIPQWFIVKRGRALSFMAIGGFIGSAAFPPVNAWMVEQFGWQTSWRVLGAMLLFIFVPLAFAVIRNKPEDLGLYPDHAPRKAVETEGSHVSLETNWTLQEAMKTKAFWLVLMCASIPALVNTGFTFHLISILSERGFETTSAALVLSLMAIMGFPISFASGFVLERIQANRMLALSFLGQGAFILLLFNSYSSPALISFGVLWGIVGGIEQITLNIIWANYFGRKHLGSIRGVSMTAMVLGSAFGPLPFGLAYDYFGGYNEIILAMLIFPIVGFVAAFMANAPKKI